MQAAIHDGLSGGFYGSPFYDQPHPSAALESACYSLLLVHAYSVLEHALRCLGDEDKFRAPKKCPLERLMKASKKSLPWINYGLVNAGRELRNAVAHKRKPVGWW